MCHIYHKAGLDRIVGTLLVIMSLMALSTPLMAQKVRNVAQLQRVVDTLIAHHRYADAARIADSAVSQTKMAVPDGYKCAAEAYRYFEQYKLNNNEYDLCGNLISQSIKYAELSGDKKFSQDNLLKIMKDNRTSHSPTILYHLYPKAIEIINRQDSVNYYIRGEALSLIGSFFQEISEYAQALEYYRDAMEAYKKCGDYNKAIDMCYYIIRFGVKAGADSMELRQTNNLADMFFDSIAARHGSGIQSLKHYHHFKARYYDYIHRYEDAIAHWDSMVYYNGKILDEKERESPTFVKKDYINMNAFSYAYRILFLEHLGMEDTISAYAKFADDSTDIVLDDLACLQYLLAEHYARAHSFDLAYKYYKQSFLNYRKAYGDSSTITFRAAFRTLKYSIATSHEEDASTAGEAAEMILGNCSKTFENIFALDLYEQLAALACMKGDSPKTQEYLRKAESTFTSMLLKNFGFMSEASFHEMWSRIDVSCSNILRMAIETGDISPGLAESLYKMVLTQKNLYFVSQNNLRKIADRSDTNKAIYQNVSIARKLLGETGNRMSAKEYDSLYTLAANGEKQLVESDTMQLYIRKVLTKDFGQVRASLGDGTVMVEFSEIFEYPPEIQYTTPERCTYPYVAVAFDSNSEAPVVIRLFDREDLSGYVLENGATIAEALSRKMPDDISAMYSDTLLTRMIWGKILDSFPGAKAICFSPTGYLNGLAIENMPVSEGVTMSQKYSMQRIFSSAFFSGTHTGASFHDIALFGGINYDTPSDREPLQPTDNSRSANTEYSYLPSTYEECDYIKSRLGGSLQVHFHSGSEATETRFKEYSEHSPSILHIATHGYYNPADSSANLLNMSGLTFAGANTSAATGDGILTSLEISELDLSRTQLAVLSACETGLGYINSDGLFGLLRGFKLAGVQNVVISLWNVSDEATSLFMRKFYSHLMQSHTARESLDYARDYLRTGNRFSHPYYWAGFVLVE